MLHRRQRFTNDKEDAVLLGELVAVLAAHPAGLRRWSVMNGVRKARQAASRDIPLKLEADVERIFRRFCAKDGARDPPPSVSSAPAKPRARSGP
jgi:hypothetical protein